MKQAFIFVADGFEEVELITPLDYLRRCNVPTQLVAVGNKQVQSSRGVLITCDAVLEQVLDQAEHAALVVLPGGIPNSTTLGASGELRRFVATAAQHGSIIAAICAAPVYTLGAWGMLDGKRYTCYPGMGGELSTPPVKNMRVVQDGNIITACAAGAAEEFAFSLVHTLCGAEQGLQLQHAIAAR